MEQVREAGGYPFRPDGGRPRERLLCHGASALGDAELLALLIGSGVRGSNVEQIAGELLHLLDSRGTDTDLAEIRAVPGVGAAKAAQLIAALEFCRRRFRPAGMRVRTPEDVLPVVRHFADRPQEHFLCISLNGAYEVNAVRIVSIGLVNRTIVHPREVFAEPLKDRAAAVVVAHNHPSGNTEPSAEDREITERLASAGRILGVQLLDHVIFSLDRYYSCLEHGEV
jgi:DNA repair protein RadC